VQVEGKRLKLGVAIMVGLVGVLMAASAQGGKKATTTIVFGTEADPALMDPSLVSDGPSLRATDQIFESLVGFKLGGTAIVPELATKWSPSKSGLSWTFTLRKGVKFSDGTQFNAAAVCFNFNRWYSFTGSFQNADATYYWQTVFGGFKHPETGNPGPDKSLYKGCKAHGAGSVTLLLTHRSSSFLGALALSNFAIASPTALKKYEADKGSVDSNGVFHPTGSYSTQHPTCTGPYMFKSWTV
jgi:peptide/nickel transport system substrate-binding protein